MRTLIYCLLISCAFACSSNERVVDQDVKRGPYLRRFGDNPKCPFSVLEHVSVRSVDALRRVARQRDADAIIYFNVRENWDGDKERVVRIVEGTLIQWTEETCRY